MNPIELIDVTGDDGRVTEAAWLARAEAAHRELREFAEPYETVMRRIFEGGGRMRIAVRGSDVLGVAVWRSFEKTVSGRHLYVDDLVTRAAARSSGVGAALLRSLEATARALGCRKLELDSGSHRTRAHAFYLRERMEITGFHFVKRLG